MNRPGGPQFQQVAVLPEPGDVATMVVRGVTGFARRHRFVTGSYLFGIVVLLFFSSGIPLSIQQVRDYNRIMDSIDQQAEFDASQDYWHARNAYHATKGWFTCDGLCQRNKKRMEHAERTLNAIRAEGYARMSQAKRVAGIFSEVAVGEAKDSFYQYLHAGKQFAKRQSMWDAMFIGIRQIARGRDETWFEYALKVLMQVLLNFSMGLVMALIMFVGGLYSIVRSYQANPLFAVIFFVSASLAAFAFVATYLIAIYGAAAGSVYGVLKLAETSARARIADDRRRQPVYDRPHYN